jgi:hypothetical protein
VITDLGAGKPAIATIPDPNGNPKTNLENLSARGKATSKPANEVITGSEVITDPNLAQGDEVGTSFAVSPARVSACTAFREAIELGLSQGRNAMAIWQDLVSQSGFTSSYQSVQRFVRKLRGAQAPEARVVIVTAPGQEAQVDYGSGPMVRDPETGKYRRTRLFVMTLGSAPATLAPFLLHRFSSEADKDRWSDLQRFSETVARRAVAKDCCWNRGPRATTEPLAAAKHPRHMPPAKRQRAHWDHVREQRRIAP